METKWILTGFGMNLFTIFCQKSKAVSTAFFQYGFYSFSHDPFKIPSQLKGKFKKGQDPIYENLSCKDYS
jgi:hypothetical protein